MVNFNGKLYFPCFRIKNSKIEWRPKGVNSTLNVIEVNPLFLGGLQIDLHALFDQPRLGTYSVELNNQKVVN